MNCNIQSISAFVRRVVLMTATFASILSAGLFAADWEYYRYGLNSVYPGVFAENARNDGTNSIFVKDTNDYINEYTWTGSSYTSLTLPSPGVGLAFNSGVQGVAVGEGRNDGKNYIYRVADKNGEAEGLIGRVLEYEWTGSEWSAAVLVGTGPLSMTDVAVGTLYYPDADSEHVFGANADGWVYMYEWNGSSYYRVKVGSAAAGITAIAVGDGYNDNTFPERDVYAVALDSGIYRYSWIPAGGWQSEIISTGTHPMNDIVVYNNPDIDNGVGTECLYTACEDGHVYQFKYDLNSSSWIKTDMGNTGSPVKELVVGTGRSDGVERVYARSGSLSEFTYSGGAWEMEQLVTAGSVGLHLSIGEMRGTGLTSIFISDGSMLEEYIYDSIPPSAITTLSASPSQSVGAVDLRWISPGDDGTRGPIHNDTAVPDFSVNGLNDIGKFRIDYSTYSKSWSTSTYQIDIATVAYPGELMSYSVGGLIDTVTYYFRIWTSDNVGNWSDVSNISTATAGALAGTYVYSDIGSDTTWTTAASPYVLNTDLAIAAGATLTIDAGVEVLFRGNYKIECLGSIIANGTSASGVLFDYYITSATAAGDWNMINLSGSNSHADFSYCTIRGASKAVQLSTSSAASSFSKISVSSCTYGIYGNIQSLWRSTSAPYYTIEGSTFSFCSTAIDGGYANVSGSVFTNNTIGVNQCRGSFTASSFSGNTAGLIGYTDSPLTTEILNVDRCSFIANTTGTLNIANITYSNYSGNVIGAEVIRYYSGADYRYNFVGNTLSGNTTGVIVVGSVGAGVGFEFHHNNIYGNSARGLYAREQTNGTFPAEYNWWGSTITAVIDEAIYDWPDAASGDTVSYEPSLTSAYSSGTSPEAVTNLNASASSSGGSVRLVWTATADDNGAVVTSYNAYYRLKRSENPAHVWAVNDYDSEVSTTISAGDTMSAEVSGLSGGTTYYFAVWLGDSEGNWSAVSNISSATPSGFTVSGYVLDHSSSALPGTIAVVNMSGDVTDSAATDSSGYFEFTDIQPGSYVFTPYLAAYSFSPSSYSASTIIDNVENLKFFGTSTPYSIAGHVLAVNGDPVEAVRITASGGYTSGLQSGSDIDSYADSGPDGSWSILLYGRANLTLIASNSNYDFENGGIKEYFGYELNLSTVNFQSVNPPIISIDDTSLDFGAIDPHTSRTLNLSVANSGREVLKATATVSDSWLSVASPYRHFPNSATFEITAIAPPSGSYSGFIYFTSNGGISTVTVTVTATCVIPAPNPLRLSNAEGFKFTGNGISPTGYTTINIYTINGNLVRSLKVLNGNGNLSWDARNSAGNMVVPGIYLYTHSSNTENGAGKFTVIK